MNHIRNTFLAVMILTSCNNKTKQSTLAAPVESVKPVAITEAASCYAMINSKDKVVLHVSIDNNIVTGDLAYNYFEKDKSSGTVNGEMKGDTLTALYTFISEGKESERRVFFLRTGNEFIEGYGTVNASTGMADLTNSSPIEYDGNTILKKIDCAEDDHGCIGVIGSRWSVLRNSCLNLSETAVRLNPIEMQYKDKAPAYILFSANQSQVELFLPENTSSVVLQRKGKEGNWSWEYDDLKLIPWKGYVLKKGKLAIYGGM